MILDILANHTQYAGISPRFARAFAFLQQLPADAAVGRHEIDGEEIYAFVQQHATKPVAEKLLEVHRRYIDIQYMVRGREIIQWAPLADLRECTMAFDPKVDAALYKCTPDMVPVPLLPGQFTILFPEDGHAPSCAWGDPAEVRKVVVKVQV
jgi:YhcH/YjgK/YiaL family protein